MSTDTTAAPDAAPADQGGEAAKVDAELARLQDALRRLGDGDLHRAGFDGGWTVAQVVSHLSVCTVLWLGDLERLRQEPSLRFFYREEIGHDCLGYPPPTVENAVGRLESTRTAITGSLAGATAAVADRTVEIPDLGTMTIAEWTPLIAGHLVMHVGQAFEVMDNRGFRPEGV